MSLHYLLDGYNIIKQSPRLGPQKLEDGRAGLIAFIENRQPQGSRNNPVTVVFDGQPGVISERKFCEVNVIFSVAGSADDKIKDLVAASAHKKNMVVVTDDRPLKGYVRALGAQSISVKEFLSQAKAIYPLGKETKYAQKNISYSVAEKITTEFEEIWLKKRKA